MRYLSNLVSFCLVLQTLQFVSERLNSRQHVAVVDLGDGPFHHGSARQTGSVHFLKVIIRITDVLLQHQGA